MKKYCLFILSIALVWMLCSCAPQHNIAQTETGTFTESDLVFMIGDSAFPLKSDAVPLIEALGTDYTLVSGPSCLYEGEDKQFDYGHVFIFTYPYDSKDRIDQIYITGGGYTTSKGIGIGSTPEEIEEQYGQGWFDYDGMFVYVVSGEPDDLKSPKLFFEFQDGVVSGITYYGAGNAG